MKYDLNIYIYILDKFDCSNYTPYYAHIYIDNICVYMTLNTEGGLWEKDRIMECTRDEREDYLGRCRGLPTRM